MADLDAIRQGIAANLYPLKTARVVGHVSAYMQENPQTPALHVPGVAPFDYGDGFGTDDTTLNVLIEAILGRATDIGAQKTLNQLLASSGSTSLKAAAETDKQLTSRLGDTGAVTTGEDPACDDLLVTRYLGQTRTTINGGEVLVATWAVRVLT